MSIKCTEGWVSLKEICKIGFPEANFQELNYVLLSSSGKCRSPAKEIYSIVFLIKEVSKLY